MNKLILFLAALFTSYAASSQNYRLVQPGVVRYFTNADHYLRAARVDSVTVSGTDTVLHLFRSPRGEYDPQYPHLLNLEPGGGSWLGKAIIIQQDGIHLIPNYWGDTVMIETQAELSHRWILYEDTANSRYEATVTAIDTTTVLGNVDSVKTISITAYFNGQVNTFDPLHQKQFRISKSYGIISTCDLFMFPIREPGIAYQKGFDYLTDLAGNIMFDVIDFRNPTLAEIYDWGVGDVFQRHRIEIYGHNDDIYETDYILAKHVVSSDEVKYTINRWKETVTSTGSAPPTQTTQSSVFDLHIKPALLFDSSVIPEKTGNKWYYYYNPNDSSWCGTGAFFSYCAFAGCENYELIKGLGVKASNECIPLTIQNQYSEWAVYAKKNGKECGSKYILDVSSVKEGKISTIYPNPAQDVLTIHLDGRQYQASVINSIGQLVKTFTVAKEKEIVYIGDLPNGVYNLRLMDKEGFVNNQKFIVRH